MKLLHVKLEGQYKGLKDQEFDFRGSLDNPPTLWTSGSENVTALVGLNGSGKSQLLELICESFAWLERYHRKDFKRPKPLPFSVTLVYQIRMEMVGDQVYSIIIRDDGSVDDSGVNTFRTPFSNPERTYDLPYIIGYSSGLNENLQRSFMKNAVQYYDNILIRAKRRKGFSQKDISSEEIERISQQSLDEGDTPISNMVFLDYDCNALLFVCLGMLPTSEFDELFPEINCHLPRVAEISYNLRGMAVVQDAISDIQQLIRVVGDHNVTGIGQRTSNKDFDLYGLDYLAGKIIIDFTDLTIKNSLVSTYFDPLTLFIKLYKIQLLGVKAWQTKDKKELRKDAFMGNVKKPLKTKLPLEITKLELRNGRGNIIDFDDLSDGEAQLIQVLSAIRLFRHKNVLFVFDEPETHLNPLWRTDFHRYLKKTLAIFNSNPHVLLSTHSPFMVSSLQQKDVLVLERTDGGGIVMNTAANQTYGASFEVLAKQLYGIKSLISQTAIEDIKQHLESQNKTETKKWIEESLGDSMEKGYLLRKLDE